MKEKEVDVYLSLASWCHFVILGVGGALVTEIFAEIPRFEVVFLSAFGLICFGLISIILYAKTFNIIENQTQHK